MLVAYSRGLHHVLPPGKIMPRLFQRIKLAIEIIDVDRYLEAHSYTSKPEDHSSYMQSVQLDLERRRNKHCIDKTKSRNKSHSPLLNEQSI